MAMEMANFENIASTEQKKFLRELGDSTAAKEYILTVSGSIEIWKDDMKWLEIALYYLKKEENVLKKEEKSVEHSEQLNASLKLPLILKRHFPHLFEGMELDNLYFDDLFKKIHEVEIKVGTEEHYLFEYIAAKKAEMPFLFER